MADDAAGDTDHFDIHCSRCGDEYPAERKNALCEYCVKNIQWSKLMNGVRCDRCDEYGWIYGTTCDIQRAMNGRDTRCPECHGTSSVAWEPDPDDVLYQLKALAKSDYRSPQSHSINPYQPHKRDPHWGFLK